MRCRNDRVLLIHFRKHNGMAHTNITLVWPAHSNLRTMFPYDPILQFCYPSICDFASRLTLTGETGSIREALNKSVPRIFGPLREHVNVSGENSITGWHIIHNFCQYYADDRLNTIREAFLTRMAEKKRQGTYKRNIEARSRNHSCRGKINKHCMFWMSEFWVIQRTTRMGRIIFSSVACLINGTNSGKRNYWTQNAFLFSLRLLSETLLILRWIRREI